MIADQAEKLKRWVKRKELGLDVDLVAFMEDKLTRRKRLIVFLGNDSEAMANSNLLANIAVALTKQGNRVLILDAYKEKIDSSIPLGIHPRFKLEDALNDNSQKSEFLYKGAGNVKFVKVAELLSNLDKLDFEMKKKFFDQWVNLEEEADIILINENRPQLALAVSEVVIVTSTSNKILAYSYANIKQLIQNTTGLQLALIINMCHNETEAAAVAKRLIATVKRFLNIEVDYLGSVLLEPEVIRSLKSKAPFVLKYPYCPATGNVNAITAKISRKEYPRAYK